MIKGFGLILPGFVGLDWFDLDQVSAAITDKTKAIMPVGIYGQTADMTTINEIAARNGNLPVIEDAAQSFGATHHGKKSCSLSTIGSTSFFPSKPLGGYGDGGALFTDDDDLAETMRQIRSHGQAKKHHHPILGLNGRLDTIQAAVVLTKLDIFDDEIKKRQEVAVAYNEYISQKTDKVILPELGEGNTSVYAQYTVLTEDPVAVSTALSKSDVPSVSYYAVPLHLQPVFDSLGHKAGDFPVTEKVSSQCLSLPMNPYLSDQEIEQVCAAFEGV
jgi:UDP-2-acetamido-2-deoxy-ribo-hexuluronate aminotransferase